MDDANGGSAQPPEAAPGALGLVPVGMSQYDLLSTAFKAPEFTRMFGGALQDRTVLDYFALSPFFDRQSTNQMLRMQAVEMVPVGRWDSAEEAEKLRSFVGIEYVVAHSAAPSLFVIHRRYRSSPTETETQAVYFVLNDAIMQSPDLFSVLGNRLTATYDAISKSMAAARAAQPPLDLRMSASTARAFKVYQPPAEDTAEREGIEAPTEAETNASKRPSEATGGEPSEKRVRIAP